MTGGNGSFLRVDKPVAPSSKRSDESTKVDQAWQTLKKDITYLSRQADLFTVKSTERRQLCQETLNRFYWQVRYGCQNPDCSTPTCLSNQKRQAQGPFRRLTILSSRTLASYLASQDYPERHLCPHKPAKHNPENPTRKRKTKKHANLSKTVAVDGANEEDSQMSQVDAEVGENDIARPAPGLNGKKAVERTIFSADQFKTVSRVSASTKANDDSASKEKTKDPKSFTQNLYDTFPWKFLQLLRYKDGRYWWMPLFVGTEAKVDDIGALTERYDAKIEKAKNSFNIPNTNDAYLGALPEIQFNPVLARDAQVIYPAARNPRIGATNEKYIPSDETEKVRYGRQISQETASPDFLHGSPTLSHFTSSNVEALVTVFKSANPLVEDERQLIRDLGRTGPLFVDSLSGLHDTMRVHAFATQSLTHVLGTTKTLLRSFLANSQASTVKEPPHHRESVDSHEMVQAFRQLKQIEDYPQHIFPSLWISLGDAFASDRPKDWKRSKKAASSGVLSRNQSPPDFSVKILHDSDAAHLVKIALSALVASVPTCAPGSWLALSKLRSNGSVALPGKNPSEFEKARSFMKIMDAFEDELALNLMKRLLRVFTTRRCRSEITRTQDDQDVKSSSTPEPLEFVDILLKFLQDGKNELHRIVFPLPEQVRYFNLSSSGGEFPSMPAAIVEWLRTIMLKEWDGNPEVSRWGIVGGAVDFMHCLYQRYSHLGLTPEIFHTPFLSERLDSLEMPVEWLSKQTKRETLHLLSVPFLFEPSALVTYFRAINHAAMTKAFDSSMTTARLMIQMSGVTNRSDVRLYNRLKTAMTSYLVLEIRRDDILTGALNQLWRRERRELMKPLKVRMGMDEGEEGVDHGGVQQEFFRLAISEALNPDYGLFTTDPVTKMAWFQPCSLEPLYKFELLGLLTSLAIYNGLTLPVTFPLALYRKLLDLPVTNLYHIQDGWPELSKGLDNLLKWSEGDVEDTFMRSYAFSVEIPGSRIYVDMEQIGRDGTWPVGPSSMEKGKAAITGLNARGLQNRLSDSPMLSPQPSSDGSDSWVDVDHLESTTPDRDGKSSPQRPAKQTKYAKTSDTSSAASEPGMVTNANRGKYVEDYVFWLTDKSIRPQYNAFARGFFVCLEKKALSIFTPEALQTVVEGIQEIDVDELEKTARYENGYSASHRVIRDFWEVVRSFSPEKIRRLLAFVTASDRIPVNGIRSIMFVVQRNGTDDERLPTSLTCFGRLLLPEYSTKKRLKDRLRVALENSQGFGVA